MQTVVLWGISEIWPNLSASFTNVHSYHVLLLREHHYRIRTDFLQFRPKEEREIFEYIETVARSQRQQKRGNYSPLLMKMIIA